ncbi:heparan sulfate glucosamine 3-O-sulfotransferase 1-like [Convolutriloba macropyga]|uniref:heparan sulfate glucosamine 3-O-sulfotransferase 1-like n=1 Tax=Convolutriloba macropyga TaxID=536237 RepID=UPI003F521657
MRVKNLLSIALALFFIYIIRLAFFVNDIDDSNELEARQGQKFRHSFRERELKSHKKHVKSKKKAGTHKHDDNDYEDYDNEDDEVDYDYDDYETGNKKDGKGFQYPDDGNEKRKRRFPTVLIIGSQKGGTTSLSKFLTFHPLIAALGRERHYFDRYAEEGRQYKWYLKRMPKSYENQYTIEKTPNYLTHEKSPELVLQYQKFLGKKLKFVLIVRDPIRRCISHTYHSERHGRLQVQNLTKAIFNSTMDHIENSLYGKHFSNWLKYFPREQFLILDGEKFAKKNPAPILRQVEDFLQIPHVFQDSDFTFSEEKGFYCYRPTTYCFPEHRGHSSYPHKLSDSEKTSLKNIFSQDLAKFWSLAGVKFNWVLGEDV